jgi:hypothetical protein
MKNEPNNTHILYSHQQVIHSGSHLIGSKWNHGKSQKKTHSGYKCIGCSFSEEIVILVWTL